MNVYQIIRDAAEKWPEEPAIYDEFGAVTFAELLRETELLKDWLIEAGVQPGMGIGMMCRNSRFFIYGLFAAVGAGGVVLPLSHQMKKAEIDEVVDATRLHVILDDESGADPLAGQPLFFRKYANLDSFRLQFSKHSFNGTLAAHLKDPVFIRYSSGTTGASKGVVIGHRSVYERVDAANQLLQLKPGEVVLWVLPMAFHFVVSIVLYLRVGAAIAVSKDFLAETMINYARQYNATLLYASPMHIRMLANHAGPVDLTKLKTVISTSTAISGEDIRRFTEKTGKEVSQAYGIIEIGLPIVNHKSAAEHPEAVGHALPAYRVGILDDDGKELPPGETGRLAIAGPGMFDGYLSPPAARDEILNGAWFMTGDLATKAEDGLITIRGREKSMINVSGNKVFPEEVEHVLNTHPSVKISRVFGGKHPLLGEVVQAEIVPEGATPEVEELIGFCRERLSTYKVPQRIQWVEEIAFTATGKIVRSGR